jgi:hypothetical protein
LRTAWETSVALPGAMPTLLWPSPPATRALTSNRRPPYTTWATRLMDMPSSTWSLA